jgi:catechol 2,3-dioxygenase-like lactoylglutathione lyase family enzyme
MSLISSVVPPRAATERNTARRPLRRRDQAEVGPEPDRPDGQPGAGGELSDAEQLGVVGHRVSLDLPATGDSSRVTMFVAERRRTGAEMIRIAVSNVYVEDQDKALHFYTEVLGFVKKQEIPLGTARWLTVGSPADEHPVELLLESNDNPVVRQYQQGLFQQGIPAATFAVDDLAAEYARLAGLGVTFTTPPTTNGPLTTAVLDDTCGNLITLSQRS